MSNKYLDQTGVSVLWQAIKNKYNNVALRRDNDYNYQAAFVPLKGEVCLVDTARDGLRAKIGDGTTQFGSLPYLDEENNIIIRGYYSDGWVYYDQELQNAMTGHTNKIYVDYTTSELYSFDGSAFVPIKQNIPAANASQAGIVKLYNTTGTNTDGTMTQLAITTELNTKASLSVDETDDELLVVTM